VIVGITGLLLKNALAAEILNGIGSQGSDRDADTSLLIAASMRDLTIGTKRASRVAGSVV